MVKSILKDYPKVAAPVEVRVVDDEQTPTRCGARTRRTSCSWATKAASPPPAPYPGATLSAQR
jgi:hypothetical protein